MCDKNEMKNETDESMTDVKPKRSKLATASLVLGILSIITLRAGGFLLGIAAVVLGVKAIRRIRIEPKALSGKRMATAGIVTGSLTIIVPWLLMPWILIREGETLEALVVLIVVVIAATVVAVFVMARLANKNPVTILMVGWIGGLFPYTLLKLTDTGSDIHPVIIVSLFAGIAVLVWWIFIAYGAIKLYSKRSNKGAKEEQA